MKNSDLIKYAAIAAGAYVVYQMFFGPNASLPAGSPATAAEEAESAATTLSANLADTLGVS
jgi:hypothetical protein